MRIDGMLFLDFSAIDIWDPYAEIEIPQWPDIQTEPWPPVIRNDSFLAVGVDRDDDSQVALTITDLDEAEDSLFLLYEGQIAVTRSSLCVGEWHLTGEYRFPVLAKHARLRILGSSAKDPKYVMIKVRPLDGSGQEQL